MPRALGPGAAAFIGLLWWWLFARLTSTTPWELGFLVPTTQSKELRQGGGGVWPGSPGMPTHTRLVLPLDACPSEDEPPLQQSSR